MSIQQSYNQLFSSLAGLATIGKHFYETNPAVIERKEIKSLENKAAKAEELSDMAVKGNLNVIEQTSGTPYEDYATASSEIAKQLEENKISYLDELLKKDPSRARLGKNIQARRAFLVNERKRDPNEDLLGNIDVDDAQISMFDNTEAKGRAITADAILKKRRISTLLKRNRSLLKGDE